MIRTARLLLALAALALSPLPALAEPFSFVVVGDQPYGIKKNVKGRYRALISEINRIAPDLVIHVGDTKSGGTPCTDGMLAERLEFLNAFAAPTLYTPGDNEWTDCHRLITGAYDPPERMEHIRQTYFADPATSFGQTTLALEHQGAEGFPENARVVIHDVMFITAHVVGSNNGFEAVRPQSATEFAARDAANRKWLQDSFAAAFEANTRALVLAIHGDMFEFGFGVRRDREGFLRHSGFGYFAETLILMAGAYDRPVLLTFGDSHVFKMFRPFPTKAPNIMALETFGADHMHAVQVHVDTDQPYPFAIQPLINPDQPLTAKPQRQKKKD